MDTKVISNAFDGMLLTMFIILFGVSLYLTVMGTAMVCTIMVLSICLELYNKTVFGGASTELDLFSSSFRLLGFSMMTVTADGWWFVLLASITILTILGIYLTHFKYEELDTPCLTK